MISINNYLFEIASARLPISKYYNIQGKPVNKLDIVTKIQPSTGEIKARLRNTKDDVTPGYQFGSFTKSEYIKKFGDTF